MSPTSREGAGELARRILVPERVDTDDPVAAIVGQALADRRVLEIDYVDAAGEGTCRVIEPTGLVSVENVWFLVAWCRLREAYRVFRLDRIRTAVPRLETTSDRPPPDPSGKLTTPVRALTV